jgi:hypothetical protein
MKHNQNDVRPGPERTRGDPQRIPDGVIDQVQKS